ncbi:MAG TPA: hypothetical protein VH542_11005 [Steroidobacteraceae bacterium]|jgi:hypothetical protein
MKNKKRNRRVHGSIALAGTAAVLYGVACSAEPQTFDWSILAGAERSDNVKRSSEDEESQTTAIAGAQLRILSDRPRLHTDVNLDAEYRNYLDNAFDDEILGGLDGTLIFGFVPERFTWIVQDNFGQVSNDPREVDTPDNRQNLNYFTTGPDFIFRFGERTRLTLQGRWSDVYYQDSESDNERYTGLISLERDISELLSLSFRGSASRVEYDDSPPNSDYDEQEVYLTLDAHGTRTIASAALGYTELHDFGTTADELLARFTVTRQIGARSSLSLQAGREFSDTADIFRLDQGAGGVRLDGSGAALSNDPFKSDYVYLTWQTRNERTTWKLTGNWRKEAHEQQSELDRRSVGAYGDVERRISPRATLQLEATYWQNDVTGSDTRLDEWSAGGIFSYQVGRNFSLQARLTHYTGSGTGDEHDYDENRLYLGVIYHGRP